MNCNLCICIFTEKMSNRDHTLSLDYVTMEDDAEFTVIATNNMGQAKTSVQLIVEEPPAGT